MALSRYKDLQIIRNVDEDYKMIFSSRFPYNGILQHSTDTLKYPTLKEISNMQLENVTWGYGDRLYKLANKHYGSPSYWWVIAWFNKIGTEAEISFGDTISVPLPLEYILTTYGL